jgi:hypothetical protein
MRLLRLRRGVGSRDSDGGGWVFLFSILPSALKSSLGVSRCINPLLRLLFPPLARTALRRCCKARIAWGVVGAPRLAEPTFLVLALAVGVRPGVTAAEPGVRTKILFAPAEALGVRGLGVFGLWRMRPSVFSCAKCEYQY